MAPASAAAPAAPSEDEYQTFSAALSASARGRAFLAEYARRHRGADTEVLLAAFARLEALTRLQRADTRGELRALLASIRKARPDIEASALPVRAAKLVLLLNLLERRLTSLAEAEAPPAGDARLAVVPALEEPELPIPSPATTQPALTLAHDRAPPPAQEAATASTSAVIIPEVTWLDGPPPGSFGLEDADRHDNPPPPSMGEKVAALTSEPEAKPPSAAMPVLMPVAPPATTPLPLPANPLAELMLLSEEEQAWRCLPLKRRRYQLRRNRSASTLPPDKTPTATLPVTSSLPASSTARPMAPPGSTTSFNSSNSRATAAPTSASVTVKPRPISSRVMGNVNSPGVGVISASQMVPLMRGLTSRCPLANKRSVSSKPSGLDDVIQADGALSRRCRARRRSAPAAGSADEHHLRLEVADQARRDPRRSRRRWCPARR